VECAQCGIIIAKYRPPKPPPELPPEPTRPAESYAEAFQEYEATAEPDEQPIYAAEEMSRDRFLHMDAALGMSFGLIKDNFGPLLGLSIIFILLSAGTFATIQFLFRATPGAFVFCYFFAQLATFSLFNIGLTHYLDRVVEGSPLSVGETITEAFSRLPRAILSRLAANILIALGLLVGFAPGIIYGVRFFFVEAICAVESKEQLIIGATNISKNLVDGYEFTIFSYLAGSALVMLLLFYSPFYFALLYFKFGTTGLVVSPTLLGNWHILVLVVGFWLLLVLALCVFIPTFTYVLYLEIRTVNRAEMSKLSIGLEPITRNCLIGAVAIVIWLLIP